MDDNRTKQDEQPDLPLQRLLRGYIPYPPIGDIESVSDIATNGKICFLSIVKVGLKLGAKYAPEIEGIDFDQFLAVAESEKIGQIVDLLDEEEGEHVEVFVESMRSAQRYPFKAHLPVRPY